MENEKTKNLNAEQILIAEFNYAKETSFQANEDRVKVFNLLLVNLASIIVAVFFSETADQLSSDIVGILLTVISFVGIIFLMQLARLRTAWIDSIKAMNTIKSVYIETFPYLNNAFRWKNTSVPKALKLNSISFLFSFSVILMNLVSFLVGITLLTSNIFLGSILGIIYVCL